MALLDKISGLPIPLSKETDKPIKDGSKRTQFHTDPLSIIHTFSEGSVEVFIINLSNGQSLEVNGTEVAPKNAFTQISHNPDRDSNPEYSITGTMLNYQVIIIY